MRIRSDSLVLGDMGQVKSAEHNVGCVSGVSDREDQDREQLARLGKKSVLKRNFRFLSILGFNCAILITWEGMLQSFAPGLQNGGPAGLVYGFIFVWIGNLSVFSTLCELVSIAPTSGGQYHWVAMLAPRSCSKFLSYITGWLTLGLVVFMSTSYTPRTWQGTLILWLCILVAVLINTLVNSMLPKIEGMVLVLHIVCFFAVLITLVTLGAHGDAAHVFLEFRNTGAWPTQALSWFVGLLGYVFSFAGVDCSFHMCEEVENPSVTVPKSIMISIVINGMMGLAIIIAMLYGATDIDRAIGSKSGYPFIEIFYQATGSMSGTAVLTSLILIMTLFAIVGVIAATSRMFWAFARDRGLPFWRTLSKVDPWTNVPVWAIGTTSVISCLLGLVNIGSAVVYNALVSIAVTGLYSSALPALANTAAGQGQTLAWGPWHVPGVFGIVNNITPTTLATTNWSVLMTGAVVIFSVIYYLTWAKKEYKGPIMEVHRN
ncbi:amino acid permease [Hirsutella rhossiliensis]|uniref:Amino acid permease domain-containing protein n=1 Tax=Hirsutella rhossiliensis TaxID=111463 RepID=A0A9P8N6S5_9HYPO|nr:amino acid permease domain-containing protein [Hirsutella rhossiliensis]KAH0967567.1 amino acid permease domain-containing protein [Hirsutella rhossiliensis]